MIILSYNIESIGKAGCSDFFGLLCLFLCFILLLFSSFPSFLVFSSLGAFNASRYAAKGWLFLLG
jgi:hypothetical protein